MKNFLAFIYLKRLIFHGYLPSNISCFILVISFLTSLMISFFKLSISVGPSERLLLSDRPLTFNIVSSDADPNRFRTLFGDSELNLDELFGNVFVFSHIAAFLSSSSLSGIFFSTYIKQKKISVTQLH